MDTDDTSTTYLEQRKLITDNARVRIGDEEIFVGKIEIEIAVREISHGHARTYIQYV